jgi:hypothetical protein
LAVLGTACHALAPEPVARVEDALEVWTQAKLTAPDGAVGDQLGWSLAVSGDTAVLGAYHATVNGLDRQGAAYVFVRTDGQWTFQQKLVGSDSREHDQFGWSVAVSGDTVLIGANTDDISQVREQGSAFVFVRSAGQWSEQQKLLAPDGAASDFFGQAVALSGDTALIGASLADITPGGDEGAAYVFIRTGTAWAVQQKLSASNGGSMDNFGQAVALSGDTALVGAYTAEVGASTDQGAAYVYARSGTSWTEQQELVASDGAAGDAFGWSVALSSDTALVGAYLADVGSHADQGAAYAYARSGATFAEQGRLVASEGATLDGFGWSVALAADSALIGANKALVDSNLEQGSAFLFARSETTWSEERRFVAQAGAAYDGFGWSVALAPKVVLVGAMGVDVGANNEQGVVCSFAQASVDGDACATNGDCASLHCADGLCCDVECTGACAACSVAAGAQADGVCTISPAGAEGSPSCAPLTCNGVAIDCVACAHDSDCASGKYCAVDGSCQAKKATLAACVPETDCREPGCRLCALGECAEGACRDCLADSACMSGNYCSADGTCQPRPPKPATKPDAAGCGCRATPSVPVPSAAWLLASSLLLTLRRRRARRTT